MAYGIYHETRPNRIVRYYSTDYLLEVTNSKQDSFSDFELIRRYLAGEIDEYEATLMVKSYIMEDRLSLFIRTPHPYTSVFESGGSWSCEQYSESKRDQRLYPYPFNLLKRDYEYVIYVNDVPRSTVSGDGYPRKQIAGAIRGLVPGDYCITLECTTSFEKFRDQHYIKWGLPIPPVVPQPVTIETVSQLVIEETGPEAFVHAEYDDGPLFQEWLDSWFNKDGHIACLGGSWYLATPLAGQFQIFKIGTDDPICSFRIPHDRERIANVVDQHLNEDLVYRVRYTPSAALAFDAGYHDYFDGVIEWHNVKIENGMPVFGTPDVIRPYDSDEFDLESMLSKSED